MEKRLGGSLDVLAEKSLKTMGDEMQIDLEDAGKKEAEEKRSMCLPASRRFAKQAVAMAIAIHCKDGQTRATNRGSSRRRREGRKVVQGHMCSLPHN